jgi:hypothetical protein
MRTAALTRAGRLALAAAACAAGIAGTGCSYSMHEYQAAGYAASPAAAHPGDAPARAEWIHAHAEQGVVLGITDNTRYVDEAYASLLSQCGGEIVGVNTRYSTKLGFLSYRNAVDLQAFCLK